MDLVSVLVCTRNRPDSLLRTIRSILADGAPDFELIVMDQSEGQESQDALSELARDPRLRYTRTSARGKGASLNEGLRLARGAVVACTDDDCVAPSGWPRAMAAAMAAHPRAAIVFCNVMPEPHDPSIGYVPTYQRTTERVVSSIGEAKRGLGLGAGMALRRDAVLAFGGFDETFGPGARFRSGDDWDISLRALLRGWQVYDTPTVSVLHYGFRTLAEGREHALRDWVAIGALCAKPIRAGYFNAIGLAAWLFTVEALWPPVRDLLHGRRPSGLSRIVGFARGFVDGMLTPVDRERLVFRSAS
jgi:glycosyltransferase involved in cell wall biosynthesis